MIKLILLMIFFSTPVYASLEGKTLICDKDMRMLSFISDKEFDFFSIDMSNLKASSEIWTYQLVKNYILIIQPKGNWNTEQKKFEDKILVLINRKTLIAERIISYQSPIQTEYLWDCELANQENSKKRVTKKLNEIILIFIEMLN